MIYTKEVENMCPVAKGAKHEPAPIPEEGKWVKSKEIKDISGLTHGISGFWTDMGEPAWSNEEDVDRLVMKHHLGMHV